MSETGALPRYFRAPRIPSTVIAGEAAIVTPSDSRLHMLNDVGTSIWQMCDEKGRTLDEIVAALLEEYEVEESVAREETAAFLNEAIRSGLLVAR